jgi:hypothetical protein
MLTHTLTPIRCSILASLLLVAFVVATMTSTGFGQTETKSHSIFQGSHNWYPTASHQTKQVAVGNNPLYQGSEVAGAVMMANHNFDA